MGTGKICDVDVVAYGRAVGRIEIRAEDAEILDVPQSGKDRPRDKVCLVAMRFTGFARRRRHQRR